KSLNVVADVQGLPHRIQSSCSFRGRAMRWQFCLFVLSVLLLAAPACAQTAPDCPNAAGWQPTSEDLQRILSNHQDWVKRWAAADYKPEWIKDNPDGRANLCNANLDGSDLTGVELSGADLDAATLNRTKLVGAKLTGANLHA